MNSALSGPQNKSGRFAEDTNPLPFPETAPRFFRHQPRGLSLYQVRYPGCLLATTFLNPHACYTPRTSVFHDAIALVISALFVCFGTTAPPPVGQGLLIHEVPRSHTTTHHSRHDSSGRMISSSQRPLPDSTQHSQQTSMPPVGFEPTISAGERPQTYALDRAATGTGSNFCCRTSYDAQSSTLFLQSSVRSTVGRIILSTQPSSHSYLPRI